MSTSWPTGSGGPVSTSFSTLFAYQSWSLICVTVVDGVAEMFYEQTNDSTLTKFDAAQRFALSGCAGSEGQGQRLQRLISWRGVFQSIGSAILDLDERFGGLAVWRFWENVAWQDGRLARRAGRSTVPE